MPTKVCARAARLLAVLALLLTGSAAMAGSASAGGPTSAILVAPGFDRAAALYYSDPDYQRLETLLAEPANAGQAATTPPPNGSGYITVTWLIHDVSIWRIDRIFLGSSGEQLIVTQQMNGANAGAEGMYPGQLGGENAVLHRSTDPAALQALLDRLGLTAAGQTGETGVALQAASDPTQAAAAAGSPSPAVAAWWILVGLVVGVAATGGALRYLPAVGRRVIRDEPDATVAEPVQMVRLPM